MRKGQVLALDIGGTKTAVGLVKNSEIIEKFQVPTDVAKGKKGVERSIEEALKRGLSLGKGIKKVGIGIAGSTDVETGIFLGGPHLPKEFRNIDFKNTYGKMFGVDVEIDNDVHCFVLGEARFGAGKGMNRVVGIALGTGIGGGIVTDGRIERGANNLAGEIGHITVSMSPDRPCYCGGNGHFEAFASGSGITDAYEQLTGARLRASDVANLVESDRHALAVYEDARTALAAGIASMLHAFDPDIVILGGGLGKEPLLWNGLKPLINASLAFPQMKKTRIVRSKLRSDANLLGAASLHLF